MKRGIIRLVISTIRGVQVMFINSELSKICYAHSVATVAQ